MKRLLVVNPFGVGDALMTLRLMEGIKHLAQDTLIDFVGNERTADFIRTHAAIHEVHLFNRDKLRAIRKKNIFLWAGEYRDLIDQWRSRRYDVMLDYSLGREFSFLGFLAGIPIRAGLDYKRRGVFLTHRLNFKGYDQKPVSDTQKELLGMLGLSVSAPAGKLHFNLPPAAREIGKRFLQEHGLNHGKKMAVAPGGGRSWGENARFKQWDAKHFVTVCNQWADESGGKVILLGDESEKALIREIANKLHTHPAQMLGYSLPEVMAVLSQCQSFLGNDGGLSHLANALGVPSAIIFGPVDENVYAPQGKDVPLALLTENVPCRPCYQRFHFPPCGHNRVCLESLSPDKVLDALKKIA